MNGTDEGPDHCKKPCIFPVLHFDVYYEVPFGGGVENIPSTTSMQTAHAHHHLPLKVCSLWHGPSSLQNGEDATLLNIGRLNRFTKVRTQWQIRFPKREGINMLLHCNHSLKKYQKIYAHDCNYIRELSTQF